MPRQYDRNLIITLGITSSPLFKKKVENTKLPTDVIQLQFDTSGNLQPLSNEDKEKLSRLTSLSRLYIEGHGIPDFAFAISNENKNFVTYKQLTEIITKNINTACSTGLRISSHICSAAKKDTITNSSFSELLLSELKKSGMQQIEITSQQEQVAISQNPFNGNVYVFSHGKDEQSILEQARLEDRAGFFNALKKTADQTKMEINNKYSGNILLSSIPNILIDCMVQMMAARSSNEIDSTMHLMKLMNHHLPNKKFIFLYDGDQQVKIDYVDIKQWDAKTSDSLLKAELAKENELFTQIRTYGGKFGFLRSISQSDKTNVVNDCLVQAKQIRHKQ